MLPVLSLTPTEYHPSMTQVTVQLPASAVPPSAAHFQPSFALPLTFANGQTLILRASAFLRY